MYNKIINQIKFTLHYFALLLLLIVSISISNADVQLKKVTAGDLTLLVPTDCNLQKYLKPLKKVEYYYSCLFYANYKRSSLISISRMDATYDMYKEDPRTYTINKYAKLHVPLRSKYIQINSYNNPALVRAILSEHFMNEHLNDGMKDWYSFIFKGNNDKYNEKEYDVSKNVDQIEIGHNRVIFYRFNDYLDKYSTHPVISRQEWFLDDNNPQHKLGDTDKVTRYVIKISTEYDSNDMIKLIQDIQYSVAFNTNH